MCIARILRRSSRFDASRDRNIFCTLSSPSAPHLSSVKFQHSLIPVAARSEAWIFDCIHVGTAGSNPAGDMGVCRECCVLSFTGLCDGPITRPEESYGMWCV